MAHSGHAPCYMEQERTRYMGSVRAREKRARVCRTGEILPSQMQRVQFRRICTELQKETNKKAARERERETKFFISSVERRQDDQVAPMIISS